MGFDLGHLMNSVAKFALRAKRVADKNKAEQNIEEEIRKKFFEWLDWVLSSKNIGNAVAYHFNIYEDGEGIWSLELVGTSKFSATDSDWACAELFATRSHPFKITYGEPWQEALALFKKFVNSYLETGTRREILKSKAGVGIGFVDGDLELLYENPNPCSSPKEPTPDRSAEERRKKFQSYFEKNLKYISQTEISVETIEKQFVKDGICRRMPLGKAHFPTGRVVVADPLAYLPSNKFSPELEIQIPKGAYPVDVSIYQSEDIGSYMCTTRLRVKDTKVVRYICAASTKESAAAANDKETMSGFPVDAGMMTICDAKVAKEYREFLDQWYRENPGKNHYDNYFADFFAKSYEMYPSLQRKGGDFIMWINPIHHRNMPMVASGFGDGFYQSYIGYDENDEICQVIVPMVNPELFENEKENSNADKFGTFWRTMELCDWNSEGDDDKVLSPVIAYLAGQSDDVIFEFDDLMSELLYNLDTKELADQCQKEDPLMCDDTFLYSRCVALINGPAYYEKVKQGKEKGVWHKEFESLLYVPQKAWALKHQGSVDDYPHSALFSYETGSNKDGWEANSDTNREDVIQIIAAMISGNDSLVLAKVTECLKDTEAYFKKYADVFAERGIEAFEELPLKELQRIALVDILAENLYVCERDWNDALGDFLYAVGELKETKAQNLPLNAEWLNENGDISEWSAVIDTKWEQFGMCLAAIDIESDSYVLFPCKIDTLQELEALAKAISERIDYAKNF